MNAEDLKVRKYWLICLLMGVGMTLLQLMISFRSDSNGLQGKNWVFLGTVLFTIGFNYLFYRCAYKKSGTKFLMFFLIVVPISCLMTIYFHVMKYVPVTSYFPFYWVLQGLSWIVCAVQYGLNWKMRKINLRLQAKNLPA